MHKSIYLVNKIAAAPTPVKSSYGRSGGLRAGRNTSTCLEKSRSKILETYDKSIFFTYIFLDKLKCSCGPETVRTTVGRFLWIWRRRDFVITKSTISYPPLALWRSPVPIWAPDCLDFLSISEPLHKTCTDIAQVAAPEPS